MKIGFDNEKYLKIQSEHIKERIDQFGFLTITMHPESFRDLHQTVSFRC